MMLQALAGLTWKHCLVYIDDIIVFSQTLDGHVEALKAVFEKLDAANLKIKPEKCEFASDQVEFLGHRGNQYFTALDLRNGYWQMGLTTNAKAKTAFACYRGQYQFTRMPFGCRNAPGGFSRMMLQALAGLTWKHCLVYIDDIIVFSQTLDGHVEALKAVCEKLDAANLKIKPEKCEFASDQVEFLGHIVRRDGLLPAPKKQLAVQNFSVPKTPKEVRSFLGLANYFAHFMEAFRLAAVPLEELIKKGVKFKWLDKHTEAVNKIKEMLLSPPVLAHPNFEKSFIVETDASQHGMGAVLIQVGEDGLEHPVMYYSKKFNKAEKNYIVSGQEALGVVYALRKWRGFVCNGKKIIVRTDHAPLKVFNRDKGELSQRLSRWLDFFGEYTLEFVHKPGCKNNFADGLSRQPVEDAGDDDFAIMLVRGDDMLVYDETLMCSDGEIKYEKLVDGSEVVVKPTAVLATFSIGNGNHIDADEAATTIFDKYFIDGDSDEEAEVEMLEDELVPPLCWLTMDKETGLLDTTPDGECWQSSCLLVQPETGRPNPPASEKPRLSLRELLTKGLLSDDDPVSTSWQRRCIEVQAVRQEAAKNKIEERELSLHEWHCVSMIGGDYALLRQQQQGHFYMRLLDRWFEHPNKDESLYEHMLPETLKKLQAYAYSEHPRIEFPDGERITVENLETIRTDRVWRSLVRGADKIVQRHGVFYVEVPRAQIYPFMRRVSKRHHTTLTTVKQFLAPPHMLDELITLVHDAPTGAHFGARRTWEKCQQHFYWPFLYRFVKDYVATCTKCTEYKARDRTSKAPMHIVEPPEYPFERVGIDLIGPFRRSRGLNLYALVIQDYYTKWLQVVPIVSKHADHVAKAMLKSVFSVHGPPKYLHSDRGTEFENALLRRICQMFGVRKTRSTSHHPASNGMVERSNKT